MTDRIKQMAEEAGIQAPWEYDGHSQDCPWMADTAALAKFAALVAEDCARVADDVADEHCSHPRSATGDAIRAHYPKPD